MCKGLEKDIDFKEIKKQYNSKTPAEWEDEFAKEKKIIEELKRKTT